MTKRILLRGGCVLTMDEELGELPAGDVLVEDGRDRRGGRAIEAGDAEVLDVSRHVVMPGLRGHAPAHLADAVSRRSAPTGRSRTTSCGIRVSISPACSPPRTSTPATCVGALEALDAGVTTILDFSHCNNTPEHADAALQGLRDAGIRAVFAYGYYPAPVDSPEPVFTEHAQRLDGRAPDP